MTYRGRIQDGVVVLDELIDLPEGCEVACEVVMLDGNSVEEAGEEKPLFAGLMKFAGTATHLPEDASLNLEHYLYGLPKR